MALESCPPATKHHAIGQQRRLVPTVCGIEPAGSSPTPGGGIVQFRARGRGEIAIASCRNEHHPVGQQGRRVKNACGINTAGDSPAPAGRNGLLPLAAALLESV